MLKRRSLTAREQAQADRLLRRLRRHLVWVGVLLGGFCLLNAAAAQAVPEGPPLQAAAVPQEAAPLDVGNFVAGGPEVWTSPGGLSSALQIMLLLTVISLAPALLLMTTCFVRVIVVLGLLRQALGVPQLPPGQVITSISLFVTLLVMWPVWSQVYTDAIVPYTQQQIHPETGQPYQLFQRSPGQPDQAWERGIRPVRRFMSAQIEMAGNSDDIWMFYDFLPKETPVPKSYDDVPLQVLMPAFMLSELKTSFLIGFQIYLPFLVLDVVVSSVIVSMNMLMLPPVVISLPFKLLLFVLVDGWHLVIGMLLESFAPYT